MNGEKSLLKHKPYRTERKIITKLYNTVTTHFKTEYNFTENAVSLLFLILYFILTTHFYIICVSHLLVLIYRPPEIV